MNDLYDKPRSAQRCFVTFWGSHFSPPGGTKGSDHHLDPFAEFVDGHGVLVDQVQVDPDQEGVMIVEAALEGLGQFGDLVAQSAFGHVGEDRGVPLTADECFEHGAPGHPGDLAGDRRQLDAGVFEQLLETLDLAAALPDNGAARPGEVAQLADRFGGTNEPRTSPWAPSWASQAASETSVFRPGMFLTCRALTSINSKGPSSKT